MPFPPEWTRVPITWPIGNIDGVPAEGEVVFTPNTPQFTVNGQTILRERIVGTVVNGALLPMSLPATNDPQVSPLNFAWHVRAVMRNAPDSFYVQVPYLSPSVNIAVQVPLMPITGPPQAGPAGPPGVFVVTHGTDPNVARPDYPLVYWIGTVFPNNSLDHDFYWDMT